MRPRRSSTPSRRAIAITDRFSSASPPRPTLRPTSSSPADASGPPTRRRPGRRRWPSATAASPTWGTPRGPPRTRARPPRVADLGGRLVLPGFNDAHVHLMSGALSLERVDLIEDGSVEAVQRRIRAFAAANPTRAVGARPRLAVRLVPRRPAHEAAARRRGARPARLHGLLRRPLRLGQLQGPRPGRHHARHAGPAQRRDRARCRRASRRARSRSRPPRSWRRRSRSPMPSGATRCCCGRCALLNSAGHHLRPGRRLPARRPAGRRSPCWSARSARASSPSASPPPCRWARTTSRKRSPRRGASRALHNDALPALRARSRATWTA